MKTHTPSPGKMNWKRRLGRIVLSILTAYFLCVLMFVLLQRWLIYLPSRAAHIDPRDAGLPAGQVHSITLRADDGVELRGWHVLPYGEIASDRDQCDRVEYPSH